ncbi:MAG: alternate F1F0 ATPase, F1 subunit alpha [Thermoleophilia bacterium]|nr:alternate F1F0 ATPase, F1 subunit alpha [Thermoleophilia bacterium]
MANSRESDGLRNAVDEAFDVIEDATRGREPRLSFEESGTVRSVGKGITKVGGIPGVRSEELVKFAGGKLGIAINLEPREVAVVMLDSLEGVEAGQEVRRTGRVVDIPVGHGLLGRVVDAKGRPLDNLGPVAFSERWPIERPAPPIMDRAPVSVPLMTGIQVIDALIPIGRGQRELILGDRHTGKSAIATDAIISQAGTDVICVYCALEQRSSAVAGLVDDLRSHGAMENCVVMVAAGEDPLGLRYAAPYAATSVAEYFMEQGRDVVIVYDDLTRHARAYRELSLLLRRPPAREAYPGDIFYLHSRLLERSTRLNDELGGGSLTALPIVETEAQNIAAYIPTNLISITDGQIYLSPRLFQEGILPPVDVGRSVSRVGGKAQLPAYKAVAADLKLSYSQFEELETFSRFGATLEEKTARALERGRRVREALRQPQYQARTAPQQIAILLAVTRGYLDGVPLSRIEAAKQKVQEEMALHLPELSRHILEGKELGTKDLDAITYRIRNTLEELKQADADAGIA